MRSRHEQPTVRAVTPEHFDTVLFDLDGVVTATAKAHAASWKALFDDFLRNRAAERGEVFTPFDDDEDYRLYVDGRPRYEGVRCFLDSRGIALPYGTPEEAPGEDTICALGNIKNIHFNRHIREHGADVFPGTVRWIEHLKAAGILVAVVSSSKNTPTILEVTGLDTLFDLSFDGNDAARMNLTGKPAPDTFLAAAGMLKVAPPRAVVVEDAISGVQAGRAGGFGLVIGVDRVGHGDALAENGADLVVTDLAEMLT